jgi:glycosyltransferase involved in cell wall biosynthesis
LFIDVIKRITTKNIISFDLVVFGDSKSIEHIQYPCLVHRLGSVRDDRLLALAYSAADVMVVPSRQEAFCQTASEAQACGTPVVAFNNSGPADIIIHHETGWLSKAFDTEDMAEGILWVLSDKDRRKKLAQVSRKKAVERFSQGVVARQYLRVYEEILFSTK